jgi:diguanylate cyclase (GGDEF)-like protein
MSRRPELNCGGRASFDDVPVAILLLDDAALAIDANGAWSKLTGRSVVESLGGGWLDALDPSDREPARDAIAGAGEPGALAVHDWSIQHDWSEQDEAGRTVSATIHRTSANLRVAALIDTSLWRARLEDLERQASRDSLTGLLNRAVLAERVGQALARSERSGLPPTLFFMDLDGFKTINDSYGHLTGDTVLRAVAAQLNSAARDSDTLARVGGDEFALLCEDLREVDADKVVSRLQQAAARPIAVEGREVHVGISVGAAIAEAGKDTFHTLLLRADRSLYGKKTDAHPTSTAHAPLRLASCDARPDHTQREGAGRTLRRALHGLQHVLTARRHVEASRTSHEDSDPAGSRGLTDMSRPATGGMDSVAHRPPRGAA